ncbi:von Willebrand factor type A domain-containing protein [bacterium]|nr:von Willebrand factor type A domain-containing protein [bacterium]
MKKIAYLSFVAIVLIALVSFLKGATGDGKISGTIADTATGKPLSNVLVKLIGSGVTTQTDSTGYFVFTNIGNGQYDLLASLNLYQNLKVEDIDVISGNETNLELTLKILVQGETNTATIAAKDVKPKIAKEQGETEEPLDMIMQEKSVLNKAGKTAMGRGVGVADGLGSVGGINGYVPLNPPNGEKYWDMYHHDYGTNPFIDTEDDNLSTFGADVSTGSYALVRNYISHGELPPKDAVRVEEFINYFRQDYAVPSEKTFAIHALTTASPISKNYQLVKIGIKGREVKSENRKPANLTFVVDVSGSMDIENRLGLVKKTLGLLIKELRSNDRVGIVTYGSQAQIVLNSTTNKEAIEEAVNSLYSEGSTNAEAGLWKGYQLASQNFDPNAINRVILCTDGVANNGETSSQGLLQQIEKFKNKGITLTACGFGMGNYNDVLIEQLATKGDGTYYYIDDLSEAKRVFVEQLTGTLQVIAKDVKIQIEFDKETVSRYRLIGYEKRDVKDEDFRNDKVDGGEIGSGHTVTAVYEVKLKNPSANAIGKITMRYKSPDGKNVTEQDEPIRMNTTENRMTAAQLQFISSVILYAEIMRESYWSKNRELAEVKTMLENIDDKFKKQYAQYEDFRDLVSNTMRLQKSKSIGELKPE